LLRQQEKRFVAAFITPCIVVSALIVVFPLFYNLWLSIFKYNLTQPQLMRFNGLWNYLSIVLRDKVFWNCLLTTFIYSALSLSIEFVLGMLFALFLNKEFFGRTFVQICVMLPMVATPVAISFVWRIMYNPDFGIINYLLKQIHLPAWGGIFASQTAMISLVFVDVWQWTGFLAMIFLAGLMSMSPEPIEAAKVDGANGFQRLYHVTFPLLRSIIAIGLMLRGIDLFKTFDIIYSLTAGGPGRLTETLNIYIYHVAFSQMEAGYSAALSIVFVIIMSLMVIRIAKLARLVN
jgi:multiple sugar transport system permease protein